MSLLRSGLHSHGLKTRRTRGADALPRRDARVVWRISDAKAGHDSQSLGLVDALKRRLEIDCYDIPAPAIATLDWLRGRFPVASLLPDPWLLIGAGQATHLPLLAARRARGGRAVVVMSPDLPKRWFDLCVIPEHDQPRAAANVLTTRGSLNRIQPPDHAPATDYRGRGLLMIGGPSRHYHWHHDTVVRQLADVVRYSPLKHWVLTTSQRTPPGFAEHVQGLLASHGRRISLHSWRETSEQWLRLQLETACCAWVTEDSVSMIYEALTAAVAVGLLSLPPRRVGRISRGVQLLVDAGDVMRFEHWSRGRPLPRPATPYDEANRVAGHLCRLYAGA